jgi:hypothetical protein
MPDHLTTLTFAELEYLLRSAAESSAGSTADSTAELDAVRRRLNFQPGVSTDIVVAAGVASLLARGLCRLDGQHVVPGELVRAAVGAFSTLHTCTEAAGWMTDRPVVVHLFSGAAARLAVYPGSYGLFEAELIDPAEPVSAPVIRFVDLCTAGRAAATVLVRSGRPGGAGEGDAGEVGVAVARSSTGAWFVSDSLDHPDPGHPVSREAVLSRLLDLLAQPVGV